MAYQNVGTPRFYINALEWVSTKGIQEINPIFFTNVDVKDYDMSGHDGYNDNPQYDVGVPLNSILGNKAFFAYLGHNFATAGASVRLQETESEGWNSPLQDIPIVNAEFSNTAPAGENAEWSMYAEQDGFSMHYANFTGLVDTQFTLRWDRYSGVDNVDGYNAQIKLGSIVIGNYYDMPHSPELKLTMTREMDGVKRVRTKGGNDLVHHKYLKSPLWGYLPPWELDTYAANPANAAHYATPRVGRRVWSMSFNYMSGSDMFGSNESLLNYRDGYGYYPMTDLDDDTISSYNDDALYEAGEGNYFNYNLLTDDNFFSQVIHRLNGGQNRFIFNPAGGGTTPDNSPQNFAICKLDMKSFKFDQISPGLYRVKLKIREVW